MVLAGLCLGQMLSAQVKPAVWLDVPFVKQEREGCGAASVAMVMQYWRLQRGEPPASDASPGQIQHALFSPEAHGIYASGIERYFQRAGFRTFAFRGQWQDLQEHLQNGRPLMVALKPGGSSLHYVVVAGMDSEQGIVMLNDPAQRKLLKEDRSSFERQWTAAGKWTLLALPAETY